MKKAIKINLGGLIFHIDEEAYDKLQAYLSSLNSHFGNNAEAKEIISDIESRIAELFQGKINPSKQVITQSDVDEVLRILGNPSEIDGEQEEEKSTNPPSYSYQTKRKLFYRDIDNSVLGGVCAGIAAYFNLDPWIFRVIFLLMLFFGGAGAPIYIILWIAIPPARTAAQKLEMRGESVTVTNIERAVKEEYTRVKDNFNKMDAGARTRDFFQEFFLVIGRIFLVLFKALGIVVGVLLTIIGIMLIIAFVASFSGHAITVDSEEFNVTHFQMFVDHFLGRQNLFVVAIAVFLIAIIPICAILWLGLKLIFRFKSSGKYFWLTILATWLLSIIVIIIFAVSFAKNFASESSRISGVQVNTQPYKQLYLKINPDYERVEGKEFTFSGKHHREYSLVVDKQIFGRPKLTIQHTGNKEAIVNIEWNSFGRNQNDASKNAQAIKYAVEQKDSLLLFDPYYLVPENQKWRAQDVEVEFEIPLGTKIFIDPDLENILVSSDGRNEWVGNMLGKSWVMTENGLEQVEK